MIVSRIECTSLNSTRIQHSLLCFLLNFWRNQGKQVTINLPQAQQQRTKLPPQLHIDAKHGNMRVYASLYWHTTQPANYLFCNFFLLRIPVPFFFAKRLPVQRPFTHVCWEHFISCFLAFSFLSLILFCVDHCLMENTSCSTETC